MRSYSQDSPGEMYYGMEDEERRININALSLQNVNILTKLFVMAGMDEGAAQESAYAVLDWKDSDEELVQKPFGAEDEYYAGLAQPYHCKDRPFDSLEELMLVKGITPGIFAAVKGYLTVFPKEGVFQINLDTASGVVIRAMARAFSGAATNTSESDADSLADKIIESRAGDDGALFTQDDRAVDFNQINLNAGERVLFLSMAQFSKKQSDFLRITSVGVEHTRQARTVLTAVIKRDDFSVLSWRRE